MKLSRLLEFGSRLARMHEDPELREQFKQRLQTEGKAAAHAWLDKYGVQAGLDPSLVEHLKRELGR